MRGRGFRGWESPSRERYIPDARAQWSMLHHGMHVCDFSVYQMNTAVGRILPFCPCAPCSSLL